MSGNGVDTGASYQAIMALNAKLDSRLGALEAKVDDVRSEVRELRLTLKDHHGSVIGHGILFTAREERVTKLEAQRQA